MILPNEYYFVSLLSKGVSMRRQQKSCRFNGKELDEETGLYYFGARYYNPKRVLWYSTDPMELKHPNVTSYGYTKRNPVNAIDYEGQLIINGQHGGSGGSRAYWNGLDARIMNWVGDHKPMYVDGAMGGWKNTLLDGYNNNLLSRNRYASGYAKGRASAGDILSSLSGDESIKVITHSMGGAFGKGYIQGIIDYAEYSELGINNFFSGHPLFEKRQDGHYEFEYYYNQDTRDSTLFQYICNVGK